jgi:hypothetical protein
VSVRFRAPLHQGYSLITEPDLSCVLDIKALLPFSNQSFVSNKINESFTGFAG